MNRAVSTTAVISALVAVAAGALAAVALLRLSHDQGLADARTSALAAGRQIAVDVAAYDYRHIDADFNRVDKESTGAFLKDFGTQAAGVRDAIVAEKAVSTAEIASVAVVNASATSAQVVAALNRTVTNTQAPKGATSAFGLQIFLVKRHGVWLATDVKPL